MLITVDTSKDSHDDMRAAAAFLLHLVGDLKDESPSLPSVPADTATAPASSTTTPISVRVPAPPVPADTTEYEDGESNVINFPPPPPPVPTPPPATDVVPVPASTTPVSMVTVVAEYDSAGLPWDARIHQKAKAKKGDGTWKLQKGIHEKHPGLVESVVAELVTHRETAIAPVTSSVPLPPSDVSVSATAPIMPRPPSETAAPVPTVPVPPSPAVGSVLPSLTPYRQLLDKITDATKAGKLQPIQVAQICQMHGAPSLMQLNSMPHLIADVSASIDAAVLGL